MAKSLIVIRWGQNDIYRGTADAPFENDDYKLIRSGTKGPQDIGDVTSYAAKLFAYHDAEHAPTLQQMRSGSWVVANYSTMMTRPSYAELVQPVLALPSPQPPKLLAFQEWSVQRSLQWFQQHDAANMIRFYRTILPYILGFEWKNGDKTKLRDLLDRLPVGPYDTSRSAVSTCLAEVDADRHPAKRSKLRMAVIGLLDAAK